MPLPNIQKKAINIGLANPDTITPAMVAAAALHLPCRVKLIILR
jgi:hypothetical protein